MSKSPYVRYRVTCASFTRPRWSSLCVVFFRLRTFMSAKFLRISLKINYWQMIRPIWRIETKVLQEQSQIKITAKTTCKTVNRLARKQPDLNHAGFSNLAGARRKAPATSSICAGYFSYYYSNYTILFHQSWSWSDLFEEINKLQLMKIVNKQHGYYM